MKKKIKGFGFGEEPVSGKAPERYMISAIGPKNKVMWKAKIGNIKSVSVPIYVQGYYVDSLVRGGWVHIKMVGKHKQNSQELVISLSEWQTLGDNFTLHMNAMLIPLAEKLRAEDLVFDALLGEDKSNGR